MDNDMISRAALLEDARRLYDCDDEGHVVYLRINAVEVAAIQAAPAVDAVPVVRCKDCRHFKYGDYCSQDKMEHSKCREDDFCSYGEKRSPEKRPTSYADVVPRFEEFDERNKECGECPFYDEECNGENRCLSEDILELLKRGWKEELGDEQ